MEIKKKIYFFLLIDFIYVIIASVIFIMKVDYLYGIMLPVYILIIISNWQILKNQSIFWLKSIQWLRIMTLFLYGLICMVGVIVITTYHVS